MSEKLGIAAARAFEWYGVGPVGRASPSPGGWTGRGRVSFIINSLLMARFGGLVVENLEGLVEGGGHGHHPLLDRTSRADLPSHEGVWLD